MYTYLFIYLFIYFKCVSVHFRHGAPNYGKPPYLETPKSQIFRIKGPIPLLIFQVQSNLTNVLIHIYMYTPL